MNIPLQPAPCMLVAMLLALAPANAPADPAAPAPAGSSAPAAPGASQVIDALHSALLDVMQRAEALGYQGRFTTLEPAVTRAYDLPFMAEKSVGRSWQDLDAAQRERLVEAFRRLSIAHYAARFDAYGGERFEILGQEPAPLDTVMVRSRIVRPEDEDVELTYRMHETPDGWRIVDVYLRGTLSELAMRRSEYSSVLRREGLDALLQALERKAASLEAESPDLASFD
jgi:phospholipid transport system substrate-binding protein